jgi:inorganic triphosphatase YgiF
MTETELKFGVDPDRAATIDAALRRLPSKRLSIETHYYDSADGRLGACGLALRLRRVGRRWEQTLKAPGDAAIERHEETVPRPGRWNASGPPPHPALHAGTPAGAALERAMREENAAPALLQRVSSTRMVRRQLEIEAHGAIVELAFDRGTIAAGELTRPVCELEYELKSGPPQALVAFGKAGVAAHGLWLRTASKAERGERLAHGDLPAPAVKARSPALHRSMSGGEILRAALRACLEQALANAGELADGPPREDAVHQLRIGLRRLRTAARELGGLDPAFDAHWEPALAAAFRALGAYRDRDTVARAIEPRLRDAGAPHPTLHADAAEAPDPVAVVRDPAFQCALLDVLHEVLKDRVAPDEAAAGHGVAAQDVARPDAAVHDIAVPGDSTHDVAVLGAAVHAAADPDAAVDADARRADTDARAHDAARARRRIDARLSRLQRRLRRGARDFARLDEPGQHRVRKRLKRLRYLAELVGPLYGSAKVERFLERLRPAQDALGAYVDLIVAERMARSAAEAGEALAWFNVGWLAAQRPENIRRCAKALRRAAKAPRFW